jgi:hypothetical protein
LRASASSRRGANDRVLVRARSFQQRGTPAGPSAASVVDGRPLRRRHDYRLPRRARCAAAIVLACDGLDERRCARPANGGAAASGGDASKAAAAIRAGVTRSSP